MKINGITDVFFDLDHTLWDFDRNSALTFEKIFKINNINVSLENFLTTYSAINFQYWKLYRDEKINKDLLRYGRLKDTFTAINVEVSDVVIHNLSNDYITYLTDNNYLFDHAIDVLEYLNKTYTLHIISNGFEEIQLKKIIKSNIHHYFKTITNGETIGIKKPNPKIFDFALKQANAEITKSIMIGDSYEADILGAKKIGMDVIFFDINNTIIHENIKQVNNLISLKNFL